MKIKFLSDVELDVVVAMEDDEPLFECESFKKDTETWFDLIGAEQPPLATEIQFGDGSVAFVTPNFWSMVEIL